MPFKARTYLNGGQIHQVTNEPIVVPSADEFVYLIHDDATNVTVYTGLDSTGVQITDFTINTDSTRPWMIYLRFGSSARSTYSTQTVYVNYQSTGDMCDMDMINRLEAEMERHQTQDPHSSASGIATQVVSTSPIDDAIDITQNTTVEVTLNKWIDDGQESKLKVYSDSNRTVEVSGTVNRTTNKKLTWTPSTNLTYSTPYYPRLLSGLVSIDAKTLVSNYDWNFTVMAQPANNAPSFSVQPSVANITTGGAEITYTCSDVESDTITHKLKLDSGSFVTLTVGSGVVFGNGTATLTSLGSNQYKITLTSQGWSASTSHTAVVNIGDASNTGGTNSSTVNINIPANTAPTLSVSVVDSTVAGRYAVGDTLTASTTVGTDAESDTVTSTVWAWLRDDVIISGQTTSTYQITQTDVTKTIKARATVTMSAGSSPAAQTDSGTLIPVPVPTGVSASAGNNQATVSWTNNTSLTGETYNVKRSTTSNGTYTLVTGGSGQTGNSFVDTTAVNGTQYFYKVSMTVNSVEGSDSTATSGVTPSNTSIAEYFTGTAGTAPNSSLFTVSKSGSSVASLNGSGQLEINAVSANPAIVVRNTNVLKETKTRNFKVKAVTLPGTFDILTVVKTASMPTYSDMASLGTNASIRCLFRTGTPYTIDVMYYDTSNTLYRWDVTSQTWITTLNNKASITLDTYYIPVLETTATQWRVIFKNADGSVITNATTSWVNWSGTRGNDGPMWEIIGDTTGAMGDVLFDEYNEM